MVCAGLTDSTDAAARTPNDSLTRHQRGGGQMLFLIAVCPSV